MIVAAAGDTSKKDCKQNPLYDPLQPNDPRDWNGVSTVVTPSWFSDYVLTVGAVDANGQPLSQNGQTGQGSTSIAGPWVGIAAPGTDVIGLSPRDDGLINAIDGPDNTLLVPAGTSFSTAIVSGVAALVRAKYPQLIGVPSHQSVDPYRPGTGSRRRQPGRLWSRRPGRGTDLGCPRGSGQAAAAAVRHR